MSVRTKKALSNSVPNLYLLIIGLALKFIGPFIRGIGYGVYPNFTLVYLGDAIGVVGDIIFLIAVVKYIIEGVKWLMKKK